MVSSLEYKQHKHRNFDFFPHWCVSSTLKQYLPCRKCSVDICWINKFIFTTILRHYYFNSHWTESKTEDQENKLVRHNTIDRSGLKLRCFDTLPISCSRMVESEVKGRMLRLGWSWGQRRSSWAGTFAQCLLACIHATSFRGWPGSLCF